MRIGGNTLDVVAPWNWEWDMGVHGQRTAPARRLSSLLIRERVRSRQEQKSGWGERAALDMDPPRDAGIKT
jgi:hypothetical protein